MPKTHILPTERKAGARRSNHRKQLFDTRRTYHHDPARNAEELHREFLRIGLNRRRGLINLQSDGSRGGGASGNLGGVANVSDVNLPNGDKFTIHEAEPMACHGNSFLPEAAGVLKSCQTAQRVLRDANLAKDTAVTINTVTDCLSVLEVLGKASLGNHDSAKRYEPIIREIDRMTADIVAGRPRVRLNLFYCPRNQTVNMALADDLAGRAARSQMSFARTVTYDRFGKESTKTKNSFEYREESRILAKIAPELKRLAQKYPMESRTITTNPATTTTTSTSSLFDSRRQRVPDSHTVKAAFEAKLPAIKREPLTELQSNEVQSNEVQSSEVQSSEVQSSEVQPNEVQPNEVQTPNDSRRRKTPGGKVSVELLDHKPETVSKRVDKKARKDSAVKPAT